MMKNKAIKKKPLTKLSAPKGEYSVVKFTEDEVKLFESIPDNWFVKDENEEYCYWPPKTGRSVRLRALSYEEPDPESWQICACTVISKGHPTYSSGLALVREKTSQKYNTSSAEEHFEKEKFRRKHPGLISQSQNFENMFEKADEATHGSEGTNHKISDVNYIVKPSTQFSRERSSVISQPGDSNSINDHRSTCNSQPRTSVSRSISPNHNVKQFSRERSSVISQPGVSSSKSRRSRSRPRTSVSRSGSSIVSIHQSSISKTRSRLRAFRPNSISISKSRSRSKTRKSKSHSTSKSRSRSKYRSSSMSRSRSRRSKSHSTSKSRSRSKYRSRSMSRSRSRRSKSRSRSKTHRSKSSSRSKTRRSKSRSRSMHRSRLKSHLKSKYSLKSRSRSSSYTKSSSHSKAASSRLNFTNSSHQSNYSSTSKYRRSEPRSKRKYISETQQKLNRSRNKEDNERSTSTQQQISMERTIPDIDERVSDRQRNQILYGGDNVTSNPESSLMKRSFGSYLTENERRLYRIEVVVNKIFIMVSDSAKRNDPTEVNAVDVNDNPHNFDVPNIPVFGIRELAALNRKLKNKDFRAFLVKDQKEFCAPSRTTTDNVVVTSYLKKLISLDVRCKITLKDPKGSETGLTLFDDFYYVYLYIIDTIKAGYESRKRKISTKECHLAMRTVWGRSKQLLKDQQNKRQKRSNKK